MNNRLATSIRPVSYWRGLYILGYLLVLLSIVITLSLSWWIMTVIFIVSLVVFVIIIKERVQPIHLYAPDPSNRMTCWQLLYAGRSKDELWEAKLLNINHYGNCIQLVFHTIHPIATRKYVIIWQDQVECEAWRQLKVWARWA